MDFVPLVALAALVLAVINWFKYIRTGDLNGALTQLSVWVAGVLVVWLVSGTDWASELVFGDVALSDMNAFSLIFFGLSVGSIASTGYEGIKAVDGSDSARKPHLFKD